LMTFWVECAAFFPIAFGCAWIGLLTVDSDLIDAGRVFRGDSGCETLIALPLCRPALAVCGGLIFLFSTLDYSVPALHQVHVYSMEIYTEFSASGDPFRALVTAIPLMVISAATLAGIFLPIREMASTNLSSGIVWRTPPSFPPAMWWFGTLALVAAAIMEVTPFGVMVWLGFHKPWTPGLIGQAAGEIGTSLLIATGAGVLSAAIACAAAAALCARGKTRRLTWFLLLLPLAMPASLTGISLVSLQLQSAHLELITPILGHCMRFLPIAILVVTTHFSLLDRLLFEAAAVMQPRWWRRLAGVRLPLAAPGILGSLVLVMALSMGEFASTLMVIPPGRSTLILRIYNYLHFGASQTVAVLSLGLTATIFLAGSLAAGIFALSTSIYRCKVKTN
jgi:iron(III) transport system permease protein